jgi:hypothetical protein
MSEVNGNALLYTTKTYVFEARPGRENSSQFNFVKRRLVRRECLSPAYAERSQRAIVVNVSPLVAERLARVCHRTVAVRPFDSDSELSAKAPSAVLGSGV